MLPITTYICGLVDHFLVYLNLPVAWNNVQSRETLCLTKKIRSLFYTRYCKSTVYRSSTCPAIAEKRGRLKVVLVTKNAARPLLLLQAQQGQHSPFEQILHVQVLLVWDKPNLLPSISTVCLGEKVQIALSDSMQSLRTVIHPTRSHTPAPFW